MSFHEFSIDDVCTLVTDGTHYTPPDLGSGVPFLTVNDMMDTGLNLLNSSKISMEEYKRADEGNSAPKVGDVLFSKDGTVGKVHVVSETADFAVLSSIAILRPNSELVHSKYLGHVLGTKTILNQATRKKTGSAVRRIILRDLKQILIPLPSLEEQKRIAAILDKADAVRRKRQQAIELADKFLQSVFLDMFGDPVTNPKGWPVEKMESIITFRGGSQPAKKHFANVPQEDYVRLIQIRDFKTDKYATYIPKSLSKRSFTEDDVMIARYGPPVFQILRGLSGSYNVALMKAEPVEGKISKEFVYHLLRTPKIHDFVVMNSERTAGQTGVNLELLNNYLVPVAPLEVQSKICAILKDIEKSQVVMKKQLINAENIFAALSQQAFKGELTKDEAA